MRGSFGKEFDRIIVCVGAGGGTGSGAAGTLIEIAHDIAKSFKSEVDGGRPSVGAIISMPRVAEGARVNENAYNVIESLMGQVGREKGKMGGRTLSPLVIGCSWLMS